MLPEQCPQKNTSTSRIDRESRQRMPRIKTPTSCECRGIQLERTGQLVFNKPWPVPNAVHLTIITVQFCRIFKTSLPFRGRCCFVLRFTTRGLDRPLGLDRPPATASLINALHHFWNCSGGMTPLVGSLRRLSDRLCLKLSSSGGRCFDNAASSISLRTT